MPRNAALGAARALFRSREVPGSDLNPQTGCPNQEFLWFSSVRGGSSGISPWGYDRLLLLRFSIHCPLIILLYEAIQPQLLTESLNKPENNSCYAVCPSRSLQHGKERLATPLFNAGLWQQLAIAKPATRHLMLLAPFRVRKVGKACTTIVGLPSRSITWIGVAEAWPEVTYALGHSRTNTIPGQCRTTTTSEGTLGRYCSDVIQGPIIAHKRENLGPTVVQKLVPTMESRYHCCGESERQTIECAIRHSALTLHSVQHLITQSACISAAANIFNN